MAKKKRKQMNKTIEAKNDIVIIKKIEHDNINGIFIPDIAKERTYFGEVLSVGPGKYDEDGDFIPTAVKVGDKVVFNNFLWTEVKSGDDTVTLIKECDIYAVLED